MGYYCLKSLCILFFLILLEFSGITFGQTWPAPNQLCPCICRLASGPQLTLALGPGTYKQLDCRYQNLRFIPQNIPAHTEVILLSNNNIDKLRANDLLNLQQLKYLDLSHNHIGKILDGTFRTNTQLRYLALSWNKLRVVSEGAFDLLGLLSRLLLSGNQLGYIPNAVKQLPSLVVLELTNNVITTIPSGSFDGMTNLQFINLRSNLIRKVQSGAFSDLPALVNLQLSQNSISTLPPDAFQNVSQLSTISLGYNQFTSLPTDQFINAASIQTIHLEGNQITRLRQNVFQPLTNLQEINLEENGLENLPSTLFQGKSSIRKIFLSGNDLVPAVSSSTFQNLPNLVSLSLSQVPEPFDSLPTQLQELHIADSPLSYIPANYFSHLPRLQKLVLSENMISDIEQGAFSRLDHLRFLDLSGNFLRSVPTWLFGTNLTNLEELLLQENKIKQIYPYAFTDLVSLRSLTLEANLLKEIPPDIFPESIEYLQLGENPIRYVNVNSITSLKSLKLFSIDSRNFQCDCLLVYFLQWLTQNHIIVDGTSDLFCSAPSRLRNVALLRLNQRSLSCPPPSIQTVPKVQNMEVRVGFNVTLPCSLLPSSLASLTWDAAGRKHFTTSNYFDTPYAIDQYQLLPTGTLLVLNVSPLDSGTYTCTAENPSGTDIITYFVSVYRENTSVRPPMWTTILPPVTNVVPLGTEIRPVFNGSNPVSQVVVNVTTVPPGMKPVTPKQKARVTTRNGVPPRLTTVKSSTNAVVNIPTAAPTSLMTTKMGIPPRPSANDTGQNSTNIGEPTITTIQTTRTPKPEIAQTLGGLNTNPPNKDTTTEVPNGDPCEPNPCLHRGTCTVISESGHSEGIDEPLLSESYSASQSDLEDTENAVDEVKAHCTCRKRFGGPTCSIRKPEMPSQVSVLETQTDVIILEWTQKNPSNINGYRIFYSLVGDRNIIKSMPIHPDVTSYTMEELKKESTYRICVVAFNDGGDSAVGDSNCIWADTAKDTDSLMSQFLTPEYGIIAGGVLFVILLTLLTAICYSRGKKERDYERSVVIPRVTQSVADLPAANVFRRSGKTRDSAFYQDDLMLLDFSRQSDRKMYMNPFDSRQSIMMQDSDHINPPAGFGEGVPASLIPTNNPRRTLRIQEDMV
ncbi:Leucine-rich repeat-containing protein 15 [Holothuria leucospilota]|uniref:Leucine-rich repeat-containing protein 15 n=1 Tax=Holothuria leucospilota TaxID=206669 RepID=A0A9Q1CLN1_HOLLE|nr:Leucine-rich repeat-containing protein 15 [Holothuria leucospilota]